MATTFTSLDTGEVLLIGGQSSLAGANAGLIGPAANYSISREDIKTPEGTYISTRFNINMEGTAVLASYTQTDFDTDGKRQELVQGVALTALLLNKNALMGGKGKLDIAPYGGHNNVISFKDAKLISISTIEQDAESSGMQDLRYSFSFEAYDDGSNPSNTGKQDPIYKFTNTDDDFCLVSAAENWEITPNDGQYTTTDRDLKFNTSTNTYKTYTLKHTITGVGMQKFDSSGMDATEGHAWKQAAKFVKSRLKKSDEDVWSVDSTEANLGIEQDLMGNEREFKDLSINALHPLNLNNTNDTAIFNLKGDTYRSRNKVRSISTDVSNGSYSIVDTYLLVYSPNEGSNYQKEMLATFDIQIDIQEDTNLDVRTATINGSVTGLALNKSEDAHTSDKYKNALEEYKKIFKQVATDTDLTADQFYKDTFLGKALDEKWSEYVALGTRGTLQDLPASHQESHNKIDGVITFSTSFNDDKASEKLIGAISYRRTTSYQNYQNISKLDSTAQKLSTKKPSLIDLLDYGPFLWIPNTTDEKKATVSVDFVLDIKHRQEKPSYNVGQPSITEDQSGSTNITSDTESWNPKTGAYNHTVEWTYV